MAARKKGATPAAAATAREKRNARRREERAAAKAARQNGHGNGDQADGPAAGVDEVAGPQPVEVADGVLVGLERTPDGGFTVTGCMGIGDVRPAEVPIALEAAVAHERKRLGLPAL